MSIEDVDRAAAAANVDRLARRFLQISGECFLAHKRDGTLDQFGDTAAVSRVLSAATLLD